MKMFGLITLLTILVAINYSSAGIASNPELENKYFLAFENNSTVNEFERILIKPNVSLSNKARKIHKTGSSFQHVLPSSLIYDSDKSFYFITRPDQPSNLTINFRFRVSPKETSVYRYNYLVQKHEDYTDEAELVFRNININQFLPKEKELVEFFRNQLHNQDVVVSGIIDESPNLRVILAKPYPFSDYVRKYLKMDCKKPFKIVDLEVVPCSLKLKQISKSESLYKSNQIDIDLHVMENSGFKMQMSYALYAILIVFQVYFLA